MTRIPVHGTGILWKLLFMLGDVVEFHDRMDAEAHAVHQQKLEKPVLSGQRADIAVFGIVRETRCKPAQELILDRAFPVGGIDADR